MEYLLKSSLLIFIFYICYKLFLGKETFFQYNRIYFLLGIAISVLLPLLVIPVYKELIVETSFAIKPTTGNTNLTETSGIDFLLIAYISYGIGILFFFSRFLIQLISLIKLIRTNTPKKTGNYYYAMVRSKISPFSFFKWIVFNPNQYEETELRSILIHEKTHANDFHSIDIILMQLTTIFFWFNPFVWLYKKELEQNLEFIADHNTINTLEDRKKYQHLLLKKHVFNCQPALVTNFHSSIIKKRIIMTQKSKSKKRNLLKYVLVLPALLFFLTSMNTQEIYSYKNIDEETNLGDTFIYSIDKNTSDTGLKFLKKEVEGSFSYSKLKRNGKGEITKIKVKYTSKDNSFVTASYENSNGISSFCFGKNADNEAFIGNCEQKPEFSIYNMQDSDIITIVKSSNKVKEKLDLERQINELQNTLKDRKSIRGDKRKKLERKEKTLLKLKEKQRNIKPVYIINGKEVSEAELQKIAPNTIEKINVLKDNSAIKKYGKKGENGVVLVTVKKGQDIDEFSTKKVLELVNEKPLVIINGKESSNRTFKGLDPDDIENINILKGESAKKKYGEKGKNGVVLVTTKK